MKRIICLLLALILALPVFAASAEEVITSITPPESTGEYENVLFSNGYHGFCMNQNLAGTINKNPFAIANSTDAASDVAQELKILFTQCFTDIFVSDGSGGYVLKNPNTILGVVYHFVHGNHPSGDIKTLSDKVKAYTDEPIPDSGYQLTLENGDTITFSFIVLCPLNTRADGKPYQDFFAYQITVSQEVPHEHDYSDDWKSNDDNHWHECDCGDKADLDEHDPIVVGKKEPTEFEEGYTGDTVCDDCGKELEKGQPIPPTHEHDYSDDWKSDDDNHWHECDCGDTTDLDEHDPVVAGKKDPGEFQEGYTGDTICETCKKELKKGQIIPATHEHNYSDKWKTDKDNHWYECACGEKKDLDKHSFKSHSCSVCGIANPNYVSGSPNTGDHNNPALWLMLSLLSIGACAWIALYTRKNRIV